MSAALSVIDDRCFAGGPDRAASTVVDRALGGDGGFACLANVHVVVSAEHDERVAGALASAWQVFPDGAPIAWLQDRTSGLALVAPAVPDLFAEVIDRGRESGLGHFLFGSTPAVLAALEQRLQQRYPGVEIVPAGLRRRPGRSTPPASSRRSPSSRPHVVWVALGAPKQELWAADHAAELRPALVIGVGAAFDFLAGTKTRAPRWMQNTGLEWLHRLATEPRRLGWRYLLDEHRIRPPDTPARDR